MLPCVIQAARPVHELFNTLFRPLSGCIGGMQGESESKSTSHPNGTNGEKTISNTGVPARCSASALAEGGGETNRDYGTFGESSSEKQLLSIAAILAPLSDHDSDAHLREGGGGHALTLSSSIQHIREKNVSAESWARTRDLAQSFQRWNKNIDAQDAAWVSTLDLSEINDIIRKAHLLDGEVQAGVDVDTR
jgi:hypothetical protein